MDKSRQIYDFVNGDLSKESEDLLFLELNKDSALREEMKSLLSIKNTLKESDFKVASNAKSKEVLFKDLGLSNAGFALKPFFYNALLTLGGLVLLVSAFSIGYFWKSDTFTESQKVEQFNSYKRQELTLDLLSPIKGEEIIKDKSYEFNSKSVNISRFTSKKNINKKNVPSNLDYSNSISEEDFIESSNTKESEINKYSSYLIEKSSIDGNYSYQLPYVSLQKNFNVFIPFESEEEKSFLSNDNFRVIATGANYWHRNVPIVSPTQYQDFNNSNLGFFYRINDLEFGFKMSRENFSLVYNTIVDGEDFVFYQQPNYTTYSFAVNYLPFEYGILNPFIGVEGGLNQTGFVARVNLGTLIEITNQFGFDIGVGANRMYFLRDGKQFSSDKVNLNYGIYYRF